MNILHITSHLGAGVGTVVIDWAEYPSNKCYTEVVSIEYTKRKTKSFYYNHMETNISAYASFIKSADIVIVHYYDHAALRELLSQPLPPCRLIFWCHKNYSVSQKELDYPDLFIDTSPIQGHGRYIWSTGNMERFQKIEPIPHEGINVGFIGHRRKAHQQLEYVLDNALPCRFIGIGEDWPIGKVENVIPFLSDMDIFAYMLHPNHYGTCEQVIGEAMSAGLSVLVMGNPCEKEIVSNERTGYIAESVEDYILKLNMLITHKEVRKWLRPRVKEAAKRIYNIDNMIQQWNAIFAEMMKKPKTVKGGLRI